MLRGIFWAGRHGRKVRGYIPPQGDKIPDTWHHPILKLSKSCGSDQPSVRVPLGFSASLQHQRVWGYDKNGKNRFGNGEPKRQSTGQG